MKIIEDKQEPKPITKKDLEALGYVFGEMKKALQNGWDKSLNNELFKEDKKIEKLEQRTDTGLIGTDSVDMIEHTNRINRQAGYLSEIVSKINEIIDYINKGD